MKTRFPRRFSKYYGLAPVVAMAVLFGAWSCSRDGGLRSARNRGIESVLSEKDLSEIQWKIEAGDPVTLLILVKPERYKEAMDKLAEAEKKGLLKISLNPNASTAEVDVAPFLVVTFQPTFFQDTKPQDLIDEYGFEALGVERMQQVPQRQTIDASIPKGLMPVDAIHARELGVQGKGIKVAVIDTGIDVNHPMLRTTPSGLPKVIDFQDFTREGHFVLESVNDEKVQKEVLASFKAATNAKFDGQALLKTQIAEFRTADGSDDAFDLDGDGLTSSTFDAYVTKNDKGLYFVAIDTNRDGKVKGAEIVKAYEGFQSKDGPTKSLIPFGNGRNAGIRKVVVSVDEKRNLGKTLLNLGFDQVGHGSHVSGIISGNLNAAGHAYQGVAPEAQIMALKVCELRGCPSSAILSAMVYAAQHGANVANMSLGGPENPAAENPVEPKLLRYLTQRYGTLFVIAAGNEGPSMNTSGNPGNYDAAVSVGAYDSPEMQNDAYGLSGQSGILFWWSSRGPTYTGAPKPAVVAPGAALSSIPTASGMQMDTWNGTSMATPMVTGMAALLINKGLDEGLELLKPDAKGSIAQRPISIKRALEEGAKPLEGYDVFEQGYGLVQGDASYAKLQEWNKIFAAQVKENPDYKIFRYLDVKGHFFEKNGSDEKIQNIQVVEYSDPQHLRVDEAIDPRRALSFEVKNADWVGLQNLHQQELGSRIDNVQPFTINNVVSYKIDESKKPQTDGVHTAVIEIQDTQTGIPQGRILVTEIKARELTMEPTLIGDNDGQEAQGSYSLRIKGVKVRRSENKRFFVKVPKGATGIAVKTSAVHSGEKSLPAHLIVTIAGQGRVVQQDVANLEINTNGNKKELAFATGAVEKDGIYEIVVTGRSSVPESIFDLEVRASGLTASPMIMGAMGSAEAMAIDRLRDSDDPIAAITSPWIVMDPVAITNNEGEEIKPTLGMGSTLFVPVTVKGAVRPVASGKLETTQLNAQLLDSTGKPLVEKVDYVTDQFGFMNFPKERELMVAVHALYVQTGSDEVEVKMMREASEPPVVRVGDKDPKTGAFKATISSGGAFSESAVALVYWFDGYLGYGAPTGVSIVGNLPIGGGDGLGSERMSEKMTEKLGVKPAQLLKIFSPLMKMRPNVPLK